MNNKEQALKMIEGCIDTIQKLSIECIEAIYKAAYNEAIEDAFKQTAITEILKLKKE